MRVSAPVFTTSQRLVQGQTALRVRQSTASAGDVTRAQLTREAHAVASNADASSRAPLGRQRGTLAHAAGLRQGHCIASR
jgi:hypothetical protein